MIIAMVMKLPTKNLLPKPLLLLAAAVLRGAELLSQQTGMLLALSEVITSSLIAPFRFLDRLLVCRLELEHFGVQSLAPRVRLAALTALLRQAEMLGPSGHAVVMAALFAVTSAAMR